MANSLKIDLEGKVVIFRQDRLTVPALDHPFLVNGAGFGCSPVTRGVSLSGTFLSDGEQAVMSGYDVERLATPEEIARFDSTLA